MQRPVVEIMKDTRDSAISRNALNLQNVVDDIKLMVDKTEELNHLDFDYISALMEKSLTLLCTVDYILENYMRKPVNPFFKYIKENAWQKLTLIH